jgi:hypothetical protein
MTRDMSDAESIAYDNARFTDGEEYSREQMLIDAEKYTDEVHGMWVGEECAKKFLSVKIKRKADSIMEDGNGLAMPEEK